MIPALPSHDAPGLLHVQLTDRLRYEIVTGKRDLGSRLPTLREAAKEWGVNLHTVRRAYQTLEVEGLVVTRRPTGTRVAIPGGRDHKPMVPSDLASFLERVRTEAHARFGLGPRELAEELRMCEPGTLAGTTTCSVMECSKTLSKMLAGDLTRVVRLDALSFDLRERGAIPPGPIVGTFFHMEEIRSRFRRRIGDLRFVRIHIAQSQLKQLATAAAAESFWKLVVFDRLPTSAHNLAVDFETALGDGVELEVRVVRNALFGFPKPSPGVIIIASPQTWDDLTPKLRARSDVELLRYEVDEGDLHRLQQDLNPTASS